MNENLSTYKNRGLLGLGGCDIKNGGFLLPVASTRECCVFSFRVEDHSDNPELKVTLSSMRAAISPRVPLLRLQNSLSYVSSLTF